MTPLRHFVILAFSALVVSSPAATVKDREAAVRNDRATVEKNSRWIYNDYQRGFQEAKRTHKPLLVVLRCVPCLACAGIDSAVLLEESDLAPLLDQFVCVRIIDANALDLKLFQFDYDLSFSTLFFNGDGTVYGRYGSWKHQKDPEDKTSAGLKRAIEAAMAIHRGYPANEASLAGKQGESIGFKTPLDISGLAGKYKPELDWEGQVVKSCIHCHQIGQALREDYRDKNKPLPLSLIYPWPEPETIGISMAPDHVTKIEKVTADSPVEKAGLKAGDELVSLEGQPLISAADVSWVLDHAPEHGTLAATVRTPGGQRKVTLILPSGWREKTDISRRASTWSLRGMATGGLVLEDLADDARGQRAIGTNQMALLVKFVGQYGKHASAKNAGFAKDDVITEMDGKSTRLTESELFGELAAKT